MIPSIKEIDQDTIKLAIYSIEGGHAIDFTIGQRNEPIITFRVEGLFFLIYINDSTLWEWNGHVVMGSTASRLMRQLLNHKLEYELRQRQLKGGLIAH